MELGLPVDEVTSRADAEVSAATASGIAPTEPMKQKSKKTPIAFMSSFRNSQREVPTILYTAQG